MDLFTRVERALEGVVEGVFSRAFRTQLQPIEVAKRLTREVESHRTMSVSATYVPNVYTVALHPDTYAVFDAISARLLGELEQYLREFTAERQYQTVGPLAVRLIEDVSVKPNDMEIDAANDPMATPSSAPPPSVLRSVPTPSTARVSDAPDLDATARFTPAAPATTLEMIAGEYVGRALPLTDGFTMGRGPASTLQLADPGVSRLHVEIVWEEGDGWVIRDLGSTNGTYVNGRKITTHALRTGDQIQLGGTKLVVK
jgi:hypothetical protein